MSSQITFYGGVHEIGGNKFLLEDRGTRIFLDFGMQMGKANQYFSEFVNPRTCNCMGDLFEFELLPKLKGIYRKDYAKHSGFGGEEDNEIDAIVLTHAHVDHCAYIHYVRPDIPIYCSEGTKLIMQGFQDTGSNEDYIIFPYKKVDNKQIVFTLREMKEKFPKTLEYLSTYKKILKKRDIQPENSKEWYRFGRSQSLAKFDGREKLIVKVLSTEPCFVYDSSNLLFTGGGNGPYYGVSLREKTPFSIYYLQAILNNTITDLFIKKESSIFQGKIAYYSYGKQFIKDIPIIIPDLNNDKDRQVHDKTVNLVKLLLSINEILAKESVPSKKNNLHSEITALKDELNSLIYKFYGISEIERRYLLTLEANN